VNNAAYLHSDLAPLSSIPAPLPLSPAFLSGGLQLGNGSWPTLLGSALPNAGLNKNDRTISASDPSAPSLVSYQDATRPRWNGSPVPGPFDRWWDEYTKGMNGLINFLFRSRSPASAGDPSAPGCREEWQEAREQCARWIASQNPPRGVTGGYRDLEDCARGLVSERCGGNPLAR
jgi:hypothetical protein